MILERKYDKYDIEEVQKRIRYYPATAVSGQRQSGKTLTVQRYTGCVGI